MGGSVLDKIGYVSIMCGLLRKFRYVTSFSRGWYKIRFELVCIN